MFLKLLVCVISMNFGVYGYVGTPFSVDTQAGQIFGLARDNYTAFLGIPYGLVDEANPFGNAIPHPYFSTPHEAFDDSVICPQYDKGKVKGKIQCLHLNIYTPNTKPTWYNFDAQCARLPVMVFIHGGAFIEGDGALSTYSPKFLLRHDVIVVTINYRLGPYGNLCLVNTEYNNQGLKDQYLALKWVKEHIRSFRGDPDNVVLLGHSAGSISANFHLFFNEENLFSKVILQSGVVVSSLSNQVTDITTFAKDVGLNADTTEVDTFIQTISAMDTDNVIDITKLYDFRPCVDGKFITKSPKLKNLHNLKVMIGGTTKEMLFIYPTEDSYVDDDFAKELNKGFYVSKMADSTDAIDTIKNVYQNHFLVDFVGYASDLAFNYPMERTVRYFVRNKCTVYRYLFTYDGGRNYMKIRDNITAAGSTHGDELGYLFDMDLFKTTSPIDQVVVDRMSRLWTNFAKYGDPTPTTSSLLPIKWTPVTAESNSYLQIDSYLGLYDSPFNARMTFWDGYYEKYGRFAKGIGLGEEYTKSRAFTVCLSQLLFLITLVLLWQ